MERNIYKKWDNVVALCLQRKEESLENRGERLLCDPIVDATVLSHIVWKIDMTVDQNGIAGHLIVVNQASLQKRK